MTATFRRSNKRNSIKLALTLILFLICLEVSWLGINLLNGDSAVRVRNSLLAIITEYDNTDWSPDNFPKGFKRERATPPRVFTDIVSEVINSNQSNLEKAISLAKHLRKTPGPETPVKSDTITTYYKIVQQGLGYCADYTQVFVALAHAASIPVREWGFSIDNYGGGHAFIEIWEPTVKKWVLIDPSSSLMAIDRKTRQPLSVIELNRTLLQGKLDSIDIIPILEDRFGFRDAAQALEFYRSGARQFFLWWGNNIFTYEKTKSIRLAAKISRAMEQFVAILLGEHPQIMLLRNDQNSSAIQALISTRHTAMIIFYSLPILALLGALLTFQLFSKKRNPYTNWAPS